jgi:hypothetical protein
MAKRGEEPLRSLELDMPWYEEAVTDTAPLT